LLRKLLPRESRRFLGGVRDPRRAAAPPPARLPPSTCA
jgi:hypothetical protein